MIAGARTDYEEDMSADTHTADTTGSENEENPPLQFENVGQFVENYVAIVFNRQFSAQMHWCPQWWAHPEAVEKFTALWQTWEYMRVKEGPCWLSKYSTYYWYPIMREITGAGGPFQGCSPIKGHSPSTDYPDGLPCVTAPVEVVTPRG